MPEFKNNGFNAAQILFPVSLIALVVFLSVAFQTVQIFRDRATMHQIKVQQDKPLEDTRRLQAQLAALAQGTLKLAQQGDKNAQAIIDRLKKAGVVVNPPESAKAPPEHIALPSKP